MDHLLRFFLSRVPVWMPDTPESDPTPDAPGPDPTLGALRPDSTPKPPPDSRPGSRPHDSDGTETNPFNQSHFDRLREQGIIMPESFHEDDVPQLDPRLHAILQRKPLHQLKLEQAPQLRLLFQQPEGDAHVNLTADKIEQVHFRAPTAPTVLGVIHNSTGITCSCKVRHIKITMLFTPWKDEMIIFNNTSNPLFLESVPNGLDIFEIDPRKYAVVYPGFWHLRDHNTTVEFLLRPRRYNLLLKDEAKKRTADQPMPSSKRPRRSTGGAVRGSSEAAPVQELKIIVRPTIIDVNILNQIGLGINQTLNMVDAITGQFEYSIKCVERYLKRGDYTDVFKAIWDDGSSEPTVVAVKMHKNTAAGPYHIAAAVNRWKRELQAHKGLEYPCIANLLAFDSRLLALIIEYRDSHDLGTPYWCSPSEPNRSFFQGTTDDACRILSDISSALAYLAKEGLVHNDVKAGNILYRRAASPGVIEVGAVLVDFGLSRVLKTEAHDFGGGAPWYLAPEWLHYGKRDPPADVFSLGIVMLYLLRRIRLPDKEPGWDVNAIQQHKPEALAPMHAWLDTIKRHRYKLRGPGATRKDTKLRSLVREMLVSAVETRISACNLENRTMEWGP